MKTRSETSCSCQTCKQMCKASPCFPTPNEAIALIQNGYQSRLAVSIYCDPASPNDYYPAITAKFDSHSGCIFQDENGLCELHNTGLKPSEGKLAHHSLGDDGLRIEIAKTWHNQKGYDVINNFPDDNQQWKTLALLAINRHIVYAKD